MFRRKLALSLIILPLILGLLVSSGFPIANTINPSGNGEDLGNASQTNNARGSIRGTDSFVLSQDTKTGTMNPIEVEQSGYYPSGSISGRTDTGENAFTSLPINNESNWVASNAGVELWNLNREYAENGTFDDGVPGNTTYPDAVSAYPYGWDVDMYDSSGGLQNLITYYDNTTDYVTIENQGEEDSVPTLTYWHYHGTWNLWNQTIVNTPYSDNMTLSFSYNYVSGIIDVGPLSIAGAVYLAVFIENDTYSQGYAILNLMRDTTSRNTWNDIVYYNITDAPSEFVFSIGLFVVASDYDSFEINPGGDYDGDGAIDGDNARVFKVQIDDVSLTSVTPPSPEEVDLRFHAGQYNTSIIGNVGNDTAQIENYYWDTSTLDVGISSNVSVSFDYEVKLLSHYFTNSSWSPHPTKKGVAYSIDIGQSADLTSFTYIGSDLTDTYENFTVFVYLPTDWENATIYDPFSNDVTGSCAIETGLVKIPITLLDRLGWWELDFQAYNYAKGVTTQVYDDQVGEWSNATLLRSGNITRSQLEIGTSETTPEITHNVNVSWIGPDSSIWSEEVLTSGINGIVNTSQRTLGGTNTTAGEWEFLFIWSNGTEIAYGTTAFDMYHSASAIVTYPSLETDFGLTISNLITYQDSDNGDFLLDDSVTIVANWSGGEVYFTPNFAKNWWEADFDTSLIGAGQFSVFVNISRPYYDNISAQFTVISVYTTELDLPSIGTSPIEVGLNEVYIIEINYKRISGPGIIGANITVIHNGPAFGISEGTPTDLGNGDYTVAITGVLSREYQVTVIASKNYHEEQSITFTLIVGETGTYFESLNGSADLVGFGLSYRLVLNYTNSTGDGLVGADVLITQVSPSTGLTANPAVGLPIVDEGNGYYSVVLTPTVSGTFTIVLRANITNHVTQYTTFTVIVTDVQTTLTPYAPSATVLINQSYVLQLLYEDETSTGISGATITLLDAPAGISYSVEDIGGGVYNVTLTPSVTDAISFQLSFRATLTNYETSSTSFTFSVQLVGTNLIAFDGISSESIIVFQDYTFTLSFIRTDQNMNITGADITIETSPSTGLFSFVQEVGDLYYLDFSANTVGTWYITVTANKTSFVQAVLQLELEVLAISTTFTSLNGTADAVGFGLDYTLYLDYSNGTGYGLVGATVQVISVTPSSGLTVDVTLDMGNGGYTIVLTPTVSSTFTISLRANMTNFVTQYLTFTLMVTDVATVLIPDSVGATISIDQNHTLLLTYEDEASNPILGATIVLLNAPAGLSYSIQEVGSGVYNVSLDPLVSESTSFQLSFRASLENYQSASTAFSLFVQRIPTILEILHGSTSAEIVVIDSYNLTVAYIRTDTDQNITSADMSITTSPLTGISSQIVPVGGAYLITFTASRVGIWQITISANKTNFVTSLIQIELEATPIDTTLECLNGTAGLTELNIVYKLVLSYSNSTGNGILSATVVASEITPSTGLGVGLTVEEGNGVYSIQFTPTSPASYTIVIRANMSNHVTQFITFSLTVLPVETVLIPHVSGATISLDKNFVLQLTFEDEFSNPIESAHIEIVQLPVGLSYVVIEVGLGVYNVTLTPSVYERTSFQISFRASLAYFQSSTTAFSLLVQEIPTEIVIISGTDSESILFTEEYELWVAFVRTDTNENITEATLGAFITPTTGIEPTIEQVGEVYHLIFRSNMTGSWQISLRANRTGYETDILLLELEINEIDTSLNEITLLEALIFEHAYDFTFEYRMENGTRITGASYGTSGSGSDWIVIEEQSSGLYSVTLRPEDVGSFEITFEFSRNGFITRTSTLSFTVNRVSISIVDIEGLTGLEGLLTTLSLRVIETDSGSPITGAMVAFQLVVDGVAGTSTVMSEAELGRYTSSFIMPDSGLDVKIRIYVDKENHEMAQDLAYLESSITPTISELTSLTRTFVTFSPLIILAAMLGIGYQTRRYLNRRERRQNLEALAVKRRFDDVKNMVGVVVLHRESGIPVYSRMLRAGFDDSLISAFITAISQFRSEFDVTEKEWQITPISDIIMAVKTQNLVCAFITMGTPTPTQQERMIQFAKSVGFVFDSNFEEAPILTIDDVTEDRFDELFDELLDMNLHQKHKIIDIKGLPKGPKCLNQTISEFKSLDGFELDAMADRMAACGIEEARAYKLILDAIRNKQMIPIEDDETSEPKSDITAEIIAHSIEDMDDEPGSMDSELSEEDRFIDDVEAILKAEEDDKSEEDTEDFEE
ncbi:MAG: hypothetical protein ACFFDR_00200 [Candidatus Thorarchaeota archaeon]